MSAASRRPGLRSIAFAALAGCGDSGEATTIAASTGAGTSAGPASEDSGAPTGGASTGESGSSGSSGAASSGGPPEARGWLRSFGAPDQQRPGGLGFDAVGDLWVAGDVFGAIDLGEGPLAGEGSGLYLAKFASDGTTVHAQAMFPADGAATLTLSSGLAVDSAGAAIVTGWLEGSYTIGGEALVAEELDVFVGKWDAAGLPVWGRRFGGADWQVGHAVAVGEDDAIWIAGAALAPFMAGDIAVTGTASTGLVVLRLGADGTPEFGRWWGDAGDQEALALAVCDDGSVALAGFFTAELKFGAEVATSAGDKDMFVALLDAQGEPRWIRGFGGASSDVASHVACADAVVFAGVVTGAATIGTLALTPVDQADAVVGRIELDGALVWAAGITGPEAQRPGGLGLRGDGQVLVTLTSAGEATLGERTLVAVGDEDLVLARYLPPGLTPALLGSLGDAGTQRAGPLALHEQALAIAGTITGTVAWPGIPSVTATGAQDLALLRVAE